MVRVLLTVCCRKQVLYMRPSHTHCTSYEHMPCEMCPNGFSSSVVVVIARRNRLFGALKTRSIKETRKKMKSDKKIIHRVLVKLCVMCLDKPRTINESVVLRLYMEWDDGVEQRLNWKALLLSRNYKVISVRNIIPTESYGVWCMQNEQTLGLDGQQWNWVEFRWLFHQSNAVAMIDCV